MRKVAVIEPFGEGGIYYYSLNLCSALAGQGLEPSLVTTRDAGAWVAAKDGPQMLIERRLWSFVARPRLPLGLMKAVSLSRHVANERTISKYCATTDVDLVHFQWPPLRLATRALGTAARWRPTVLTAHNVLPHDDRTTATLRLWSALYNLADMIVCHTQQTMADLEAVVGVPPDKVTVIPHPVGDAVHSLGPQATRAQARYRLNLPSDGDLVLFFGAIRPYKNLPLILKAWRTIEARLDRAYLVIAGRSETWSTDGALIEQLGLERVIARPRWIPPSEVPLYFAASDLTALPYNHIDASGVAAQAAGFRCPMLISDIPGFRAFWHEDEARFVPLDESAWAAAVIETLTSIDRGHSMARRALARASRELTWSTSAQRHIEVYREAQQRWHHRSRGA